MCSSDLPLTNPVQLIGRSSKAEISLASPDVHHKHALVAGGVGGWWVHGLNAAKPLLLNEEPCKRALLRPGDRLTVGGHVLRFEGAGGTPEAPDPPREAPPCELEVEAPESPPRVVLLHSNAVVGSSERATIRLSAPGVSALHALLAREAGACSL